MMKDHPRHFVGLESDLITIEKMNDTYFKHEFESRSSLVKGLFGCESFLKLFCVIYLLD